jgi:hypothetical protein
LLVAGDVDLAQRATVMKADDAEAAVGVAGRAFSLPARGPLAVAVFIDIGGREAETEEAGLEFEVMQFPEVVADRGDDREHGQAALGVETVLLEVLLDQDLQDGMPGRAEGATVKQDLAQGRDLSATQALKAARRVSRSTKLFWSASRPNSRLWAAAAGGSLVGVDGCAATPNAASIAAWSSRNRSRYSSSDGESPAVMRSSRSTRRSS